MGVEFEHWADCGWRTGPCTCGLVPSKPALKVRAIGDSTRQCPLCDDWFTLEPNGMFPDHGCRIAFPANMGAKLDPHRAKRLPSARVLMEKNAILLAALKKAHACATHRDDGTCDGCFVSEAIEAAEKVTP